MKKTLIKIIIFLLFLVFLNCSLQQENNETGNMHTGYLSYEEFKAKAYKEPDAPQVGKVGIYIIDGDTPVENEEKLKQLYSRYLLQFKGNSQIASGLIVHQVNGADSVWNEVQKKNITYCINKKAKGSWFTTGGFGADYDKVKTAMQLATAEWGNIANIKFIHLADQDDNCTSYNNSVVFDINPAPSSASYLARAFFPDTSRSSRNILIHSDTLKLTPSDRYTMKGVLTHELGHVLGLRHEHTRPEAGKCFEDNNWRALTTYDAHSVMHYPQCNGLNTGDLVLTAEDKKGIALLYGQPVNNNEPDNILPVVTISSPQNNEQVSSNFTIISNASDNRGITKVEFYINNQKVGEKDVAPYSYNITNASPGATLIILVKAFDAAGNIGSSETIIVSVSNSFQCKEFTSTNIQHIAAGRAEKYNYLYSEYTRTIGAKESLGIVGTTWYSPTSTVKETAPGYFAKGSCK